MFDSPVKSLLMQYARDRRGNFAIIFGVCSVAIVAGVGAAVDFNQLNRTKTLMLDAAESAAIAAAPSDPYTDDERRARGFLSFNQNYRKKSGTEKNVKIDIGLTPERATVIAKSHVPLKFLGFTGRKSTDVQVKAVAEIVLEPACVLVTNPTRSQALRLQGHPTMATRDCYAHVNSSSRSALVGQGNPVTTEAEFCVNGGFQGRRWATEPEIECGNQPDPYSDMPVPGVPACLEKNFKTKGQTPTQIQPGHYCGGLDFTANSETKLAPGIYVISDGTFSLDANAKVSGDGVLIFLSGDNANFELHSGGEWNIMPQTEGEFKGLVIYQDPNASPKNDNMIKAGGELDIVGGIYAPSADLVIQGSPVLNLLGGGTVLVVNGLELKGSPELNVEVTRDPNLMPDEKFIGRFDYVRVVE